MAIQDLRQNYTPEPLDPEDLLSNPFDQFLAWFEDAKQIGILEPNAFTLATASADGMPNARTVLLKGVDDRAKTHVPERDAKILSRAGGAEGRGFVFYTNYNSTKGDELADNPRACMNFYWDTLARCVRIPGKVAPISPEETAAYFHTRPRGSQLGAWASHQSSVIAGRDTLTQTFAQLAKQYPGDTLIPVPPTWGGYRIVPTAFEFWQGQPSRLHDRFRYTPAPKKDSESDLKSKKANENAWSIDRLSP